MPEIVESLQLDVVLDQLHAELTKHDADAIYAAAMRARIALAERYGKKMVRSGLIAFSARYANGKAVLKALDQHKPDIRECAIDILTELDPAAAIRHARAILTAEVPPRSFAYEYERALAFETLARSRASLALNRLVGYMSPEEVREGVTRHLLSADLAGGAIPRARAESRVPEANPPVAEAAPVAPARSPVGRGDWLERYRSGDHERVWAEVSAADLSDDAIREQVDGVARAMMERVHRNLATLVERLGDSGYRFRTRPSSPPSRDVRVTMSRIEELSRARLPLSLRAFYEVVGGVDLQRAERIDGEVDDDAPVPPFPGFERCDPLVVYPAESAAKDVETGRSQVVISVEASCKAVPLDGSDVPYRITLAGHSADARVEGVPGSPSFVTYLRNSLRWGGFGGLALHLEPLLPKSRTIARKKRRTLDEWRLPWVERLVADLLPF